MPTGNLGAAKRVANGHILSPQFETPIRRAANELLGKMLGGMANEETDKLLERQKGSPIQFRSGELQVLAIRYCGAVRRAAKSLAHELARAVGIRRGLAKKERDWIEQEVRNAIRDATSVGVARDFFLGKISSLFTVANEQEAAESFAQSVAELDRTGLLYRDARAELEHARAIYGRGARKRRKSDKRKKPSAFQKLARPDLHGIMTVKDVLEVIPDITKSTAHRYANEGIFELIEAVRDDRKRRKVLIKTESVKKFLENRLH